MPGQRTRLDGPSSSPASAAPPPPSASQPGPGAAPPSEVVARPSATATAAAPASSFTTCRDSACSERAAWALLAEGMASSWLGGTGPAGVAAGLAAVLVRGLAAVSARLCSACAAAAVPTDTAGARLARRPSSAAVLALSGLVSGRGGAAKGVAVAEPDGPGSGCGPGGSSRGRLAGGCACPLARA